MIERVVKLRAVTEARGATPAEETAALEAISRLVQRWSLTPGELEPEPAPMPRALAPQPGFGAHFGMPGGQVFIIVNGVPIPVAVGNSGVRVTTSFNGTTTSTTGFW